MRTAFLARCNTRRIAPIVLACVAPLYPVAHGQVQIGDESSTLGRIIHVYAMGTPAENAAALMNALGSSTVTGRGDPAAQPVVIQLGAGVFEFVGLGETPAITMPDNVHLSGAGRDSTTITCGDGCYLIDTDGTTNRFRNLTLGGPGVVFSITADNSDILIHDIRSEASSGAGFGSGSKVRITNSSLISTFDDAMQIYDASVAVEYSVIDGPDSSEDGVIYGDDASGSPDLTVRYSYIGTNGITAPWPGGLGCAYISGPGGEVDGCPEPPPPPPGVTGPTSQGIKYPRSW